MKKILWHNQQNGQAWHRAYMPVKHCSSILKEKGIELCLQPGFDNIDEFDGFILSRAPHPNFMPILKDIKQKKKTIVFETDDDLWSLPSWNPVSATYDNNTLENLNWLRDNADHIIASTRYLARVIDRPNTVVLPNLIDSDLWQYPRQPHEEIRILFAGSAFHGADLNWIAPVMEEVAKQDNVLVLFFGDMPESMVEWVRIFGQPYAEMIPHSRYNSKIGFIKPVDINEFPKVMCSISPDIGICPLVDEKFCYSKSNLKFLEYSMAGALTIAQNLPPYQGSRCLLTNNWLADLIDIIKNDNREKLAANAKRDVMENYSWQNQKGLWIDALFKMF